MLVKVRPDRGPHWVKHEIYSLTARQFRWGIIWPLPNWLNTAYCQVSDDFRSCHRCARKHGRCRRETVR
jgi:hypothetical protein